MQGSEHYEKEKWNILLGVMILGLSGQMVASAAVEGKDNGKSSEFVYINDESGQMMASATEDGKDDNKNSEYVYINNDGKDGNSPDANKGLSTGAKIGIGAAGLSALGGGVYETVKLVKGLSKQETVEPTPQPEEDLLKPEDPKEDPLKPENPKEVDEKGNNGKTAGKTVVPITIGNVLLAVLVTSGVLLYKKFPNRDGSANYDNSSNNALVNTNDIESKKNIIDEENSGDTEQIDIGFDEQEYAFLSNYVISADKVDDFDKVANYVAIVFRSQAENQTKTVPEIKANIETFCGTLLKKADEIGINYKKNDAFNKLYNYIVDFVFNNSENNNNFEFFSDNTNAISNGNYENYEN